MTSWQHQQWIDSGGRWWLATPVAEIQHALQVTFDPPADSIGTIGDDSHLDAEPPEDHTPYSETGWPVPTPHGPVTAIDYEGPEWQSWAQFLIRERDAGRLPFIKYVNYNNVHYSWEPTAARRPSTDWAGHVHVSIRSDWCDRSTGLTPAQLTGGTTPPPPPPGSGSNIGDRVMQNWPTIAQGSTGQQVRDVQALLNAHGASLVVDGVDGPLTTAAVQQFQVSHHVANSVRADGTGDGQVGPQTILALLDVA